MSKPIAIKGLLLTGTLAPQIIADCHNKTDLPCNDCVYDIQGCCAYDEPLGRYCVLGSAFKPKDKQISIFDILGG